MYVSVLVCKYSRTGRIFKWILTKLDEKTIDFFVVDDFWLGCYFPQKEGKLSAVLFIIK